MIYDQFLNPNSLVFDVGANVGNWTEKFLDLGCRRVVALEPVPKYAAVLREKFKNDERVIVVDKAAGARIGTGTIKVRSKVLETGMPDGVSSMSERWIRAVGQENRFQCGVESWDRDLPVEVTTLDVLILEHGRPDFIKIDTEGYEPEVVHGLSSPVKALSFEFTPCALDDTARVISYLSTLGPIEVNYGLGAGLERLESAAWLDEETLMERLREFIGNNEAFGDVYVRFGT